MAVIETRDLSKRYGRVQALQGLTLSVPEGAVGLLGPNGAGKSTLIKILLGLIPSDGGTASVLGMDPRRDGLRVRAQIGYMPETESLLGGADAVTTVYLAARLSGLDHASAMQRTHLVLNYVGLEEQRYRPVETYSTGLKQKAKFAQALVHHPKLLLLDEPTSGLDPRAREDMLALIRDVSRDKGISVILSTHLLPDVEAVCREVVILDRGTRVHQGSIDEPEGAPEAFTVRVRGDVEAFRAALDRRAFSAQPLEDGRLRVVPREGAASTDPILSAAVESGVQLRQLTRCRTTIEERFAAALTRSRENGDP